MAKWHGKIGFATSSETSPGVWTNTITERVYSGDVIRNSRRWSSGEGLNDNLTISNQISVVSDIFAMEHFPHMRYIEVYGALWSISDIEADYPRLIITTGGVYNGETEN